MLCILHKVHFLSPNAGEGKHFWELTFFWFWQTSKTALFTHSYARNIFLLVNQCIDVSWMLRLFRVNFSLSLCSFFVVVFFSQSMRYTRGWRDVVILISFSSFHSRNSARNSRYTVECDSNGKFYAICDFTIRLRMRNAKLY